MNKNHLTWTRWGLVFLLKTINYFYWWVYNAAKMVFAWSTSCKIYSGNVAGFTSVFLLLHPDLVCKINIFCFEKSAHLLYFDAEKRTGLLTTRWRREIELLGTNMLVSERQTHNHFFLGHFTKKNETWVQKMVFLCTCSFTVSRTDEGIVKFFSRARPS